MPRSSGVSICNFALVKQVTWGAALFRYQYLYFCTSKASKTEYCTSKASKTEYRVVRVLPRAGEAAIVEVDVAFLESA